MKTQTWNMKNSQQNSRSVLECGSPLPLSKGNALTVAVQSAGGPAHSKTWRSLIALLGFCFLVSAFSFRAMGQTYSIDWYKIAGGGGTSTGGTYQVSGTIGQHDASGAMSGGNYSLTGGFWALYAIQTPGAPTLYITRSGNAVIVYWKSGSSLSLAQSSSPATPLANWSASSGITTSNGTNYLTVANPTGNMFFRLK